MSENYGKRNALLLTAGICAAALASASPTAPTTAALDPLPPPGIDAEVRLGPDDCQLSDRERRMFELLRSSPEQNRTRLRCDGTLQAFARERARDMAERGYFGHVTPDRRGPNALLEAAGYPLPPDYRGRRSNNIEAIVGGYADPDRVWRELLDSRPHRAHLLAELPFYAQQDEIGIAHLHAPGTDYGDYWVIVIARRALPDEPRLLCTPDPGGCFVMD